MFSPQQALDCLHPDLIDSLTTGDVYKYYANAGAIATEKSYPFQQQKGHQCIFNFTMDGIELLGAVGYQRVVENDEEQLKRALRMMGPVSVMFSVL